MSHRAEILCLVIAATGALSFMPTPAEPQATVGLYDVFERSVTNSRAYANPYDFRVVELRASFTAPSGRSVSFFGFYDGGTTWRLRFMPDEAGTWKYAWSWTDDTAGGSGSFSVTDTGLPGPARLDPQDARLLADARGNPIHWRGYSLHNQIYTDALTQGRASDYIKQFINPHVIDGGYNAVMLSVPCPQSRYDVKGGTLRGVGTDFIWRDHSRFNVRAAQYFDAILRRLKDARVWTVTFTTFFFTYHKDEVERFFGDYKPFVRWFTARYAAFYNYFCWTPAWEMDCHFGNWESRVDQVMRYVVSIDPWKRLQGAHDTALGLWQDWQTLLPAQNPSRTVRGSNNRTSVEGTNCLNPFNKCIIAFENIWETTDTRWPGWDMPRNATEVRRALWGALFANVLPIYDEMEDMPVWKGPERGAGNGYGEPDVKRALTWWYETVGYRNSNFTIRNGLVSGSDKICSGTPGQEYLVYDEDGGSIAIDLSGDGGSFSVLWYDPKNGVDKNGGTVAAGASRTLTSPFSGDSVLRLKK